jgi:hypothetical protein
MPPLRGGHGGPPLQTSPRSQPQAGNATVEALPPFDYMQIKCLTAALANLPGNATVEALPPFDHMQIKCLTAYRANFWRRRERKISISGNFSWVATRANTFNLH